MEHPLNHLLPAAPAAAPATPARRGRGRPRKDPSAPKPPPPVYPSLLAEKADTVPTAQCAFYMRRTIKTLYHWSTLPDAPLKPIRIRRGSPLAWSMSEIRALLRVA